MGTLGTIRTLALVAAVAVLAGCGGTDDVRDEGGGRDLPVADTVPPDAPGDLAKDAPGDAEPADLPRDLPAEFATDAPSDAPSDAPQDAPADVPGDTPGDAPLPDGACAPAAPLEPFVLWALNTGFGEGQDAEIRDDALVTFKGPEQDWFCGMPYCDGEIDRQVTLRLATSGKEVSFVYQLPLEQEIPVRVGQPVHVYLRQVWPWWTDLVVVLWDFGGAPVFLYHDASQAGQKPWWDCDGKQPCPSLATGPETCLPIPRTCGTAVFPPVTMVLDGGLSSSEAPITLEQGQTAVAPVPSLRTRYLLSQSRHHVTLDCVDYPDRWLAAAILGNRQVSQCRCHDDADCALRHVCEPREGRCVPDQCDWEVDPSAIDRCWEAQGCDSFSGQCVPAVKGCGTDADCAGTQTPICNLRVRRCTPSAGCAHEWSGFCVADACADVDCEHGCSSLLGGCYECIADCECPGEGTGGWCNGRNCATCDAGRIGFTQEDPFDFWAICAKKADLDEAALKALDPQAQCGVGAALGPCDPATEIACMGSNQKDLRGRLADAAWARVCALAAMPWITRISGGFYEL